MAGCQNVAETAKPRWADPKIGVNRRDSDGLIQPFRSDAWLRKLDLSVGAGRGHGVRTVIAARLPEVLIPFTGLQRPECGHIRESVELNVPPVPVLCLDLDGRETAVAVRAIHDGLLVVRHVGHCDPCDLALRVHGLVRHVRERARLLRRCRVSIHRVYDKRDPPRKTQC